MRSTEKQPEVLRLNVGMDQSMGTRGAPPGTLELVKNCRVRSGGLQKRCGSAAYASTATTVYRAVSDTTTVSRPAEHPAFIKRLGTQRIAASSSGYAFSFSDSGTEQYLGEFSAAQPVRKRFGIAPGLAAQSVGPYMPAVSVNANGYVCTAAAFGPELRITLESPEGEMLVTQTTSAAAAANLVVRVVRLSATAFAVAYQDIASTTVSYKLVQVSNGIWIIAVGGTLVTLNNALSTWDLSYYDGTTWFLVYQSGATTVTISERNSAVTQVDSATFASTDNRTYLSIWADPDTDRVWVGIVDDPTATAASQFRVYTDALDLETGPTTLVAGSSVPLFGPLYKRTPVAGDAFCVYWYQESSPTRAVLWGTVVQAGTATRSVQQAFNVIPISKPDLQQRVWCMTYGGGAANAEIAKIALLRFVGDEFIGESSFDPTPVVELASPDFEDPGSTYHPAAQPGRAFNAVAVTTESAGGSAFFALPFVVASRTNASGNKEPTHRVETYEYTRWNQEPRKQVATLGRLGFVAGQPTELWGDIQLHTSSRFEHGGVEVGFAHAPVFGSSTITPAGGGLAAGTYDYYAVGVYVDDDGNLHESAPSAPYSLTITVPSSVALNVLNCYIGQRPDRSQSLAVRSPPVRIYRTQSGGTEAQEVPISPSGPAGNWGGYLAFTDTVADSIIDDNGFLYTAGGVLPNVLAPSCRYIAVSEERLWCGGLWDSNIIECSKIRVPGEPYNFTGDASHQVVIPGEVSGLAYMDGQVCVFCEDGIYLVSGDGPNDQGAGGFAPPRALVRGIGCPREQSASILETEVGILFRSAMSYYLIPRGFGTPVEIGDKVHDEDELVLSAATSTTSEFRLAHFLVCAPGETLSDTVLTLDLTTMQWVRDEYTVNGSITGQGFSEIGEWPDGLALFSYGLQRTDNLKIIWAHDEGLTGDAGAAGAGATTYVSQYLRTTWLQSAGPLGLLQCNEVIVACEPRGSSSALTMSIETDANTAQSATWTLTTAEPAAYRSIPVKERQCTEFRITLYDAAGATDSAGVRWLAAGIDSTVVPGIRRVTDSQGA